MSLNLLFDFKNTKIPLLKCEDIFLKFNNKKNSYILSLIMEQGNTDLREIIRKNGRKRTKVLTSKEIEKRAGHVKIKFGI